MTLFSKPIHVGGPNMGSREDFATLVDGIFESKWLSNAGPLVKQLEQRLADYLGVRHCVTMANGTIALEIAIRALGMSGEVIVPSYTFIATAHALHWQGLTPVFADIDEHTHNLSVESVRSLITPRTSGIIGVHLWGRPAPVQELTDLAARQGLELLFDAAHAFGNELSGQKIGNFGRAEVLSFHATKFYNTFEGGAIATNDDDLAEHVTLMRNFGFVDFDKVVYPGTNGKMTEVSAAMGLVNLASIDDFLSQNRLNQAAYAQVFSTSEHLTLVDFSDVKSCNYQYVVAELGPGATQHRDQLVADLHEQNVRARRYFWPGCHMMEPYRTLFPDAARHLPATSKVADRVVVLPTGTSVSESDCTRIAEFVVARLRVLAG